MPSNIPSPEISAGINRLSLGTEAVRGAAPLTDMYCVVSACFEAEFTSASLSSYCNGAFCAEAQ
jgi:hypothetical protein